MALDERQLRVAASLREAGADWAALTGADSVCYATGHAVPIEAGASPFAGGPSLALVGADGQAGLVVANVEAAAASRAAIVETYEGFAWQHPAAPLDNYRAAVARLAGRLGYGGRLAIEPASHPASLLDVLHSTAAPADITPALRRMRATKTAAELDMLRAAARLASAGQRAFLRAVAPGRSELAVFADIRLAMERQAGERLPLAGDFLSGRARTAAGSGWPIERTILPREPVLCDLAPRLRGYWGDSCAALCVAPADGGFRRLFDAAHAALALAISLVRPGLPVAELDRQVRASVAAAGFAYPHHTGHGIGTAVHEHPRIVPYETETLRPDMVLMLEPAAYDPQIGGARTEWMVRVTQTGCEVFSDFDHQPEAQPVARAAADQ